MPRRPVADDLLGPDPDQVLELWLGPSNLTSRFPDRAALQRAWQENRAQLMEYFGSSGRRPQAFYEFEWPHGPQPSWENERSELWRRDLLSERERIALERWWRRQFDVAQNPKFMTHSGGELLEGQRARDAHYRWADLPVELRERWERRTED
jgi:hypothetical protein